MSFGSGTWPHQAKGVNRQTGDRMATLWGALAGIVVAVIGGGIGFLAAYRQNLLNELRRGFRDLEVLRAAPSKVKWRDHYQPPVMKVVLCPGEPGDDEWLQEVVSLKGLASILRDDTLYGLVESIHVGLEGYVREAKSFTIDDETRHRNRQRWASELNKDIPAAERRLTEWLGIGRWLRFAAGFRGKPINRRRFVIG